MPNYNKKITETTVRLGEVRFSYAHVFTPRNRGDGTPEKYGCMLLIPKADTAAKAVIDGAIEAAKQDGVSKKWGGKLPAAARLKTPLRDGDAEFPGDPTYAGMWFINASSTSAPGVKVLENGARRDALDNDDFYSGCYGAVTVGFFAYSNSGNNGIACGLNNVIKTRDGERLDGGRSAEADFDDIGEASANSFLD